MLENLKSEKKVIGVKQSTKALNHNKVKVLYVAQNADSHLTEHLKQKANEKNIEVVDVDSMKKLGKFCGIDVGAAVAAILK